jgi:hypothetical protein
MTTKTNAAMAAIWAAVPSQPCWALKMRYATFNDYRRAELLARSGAGGTPAS